MLAMPASDLKRIAGERAAREVQSGMLVGLGTGSTAAQAIRALATRQTTEKLRFRGLPTSRQTEQLARELDIPLVGFDDQALPDLTIDGADEVDPAGAMIKGGGGALLKEKVVAQHSQRLVIVADPAKRVARLGEAFPLPVEVVPEVWKLIARDLRELGAEPRLRLSDGQPYLTDNGNAIIDAKFSAIPQPAALERQLNARAGVVENGLFVDLLSLLVVGQPEGAVVLSFER